MRVTKITNSYHSNSTLKVELRFNHPDFTKNCKAHYHQLSTSITLDYMGQESFLVNGERVEKLVIEFEGLTQRENAIEAIQNLAEQTKKATSKDA